MASASQLRALRKKHHLGEFRHTKQKTKTRGSFMARHKRRSGRSSGMKGSNTPEALALSSAVYGGVRPMVARMIPNIPQLGGYGDNVILGGIGYLGAKKGQGFVKTAGTAILISEAFLAGMKLSASISPMSQQSGDAVVYI